MQSSSSSDFDQWNALKKNLDSKVFDLYFKEGEVWWASIGRNIGTEVYGKGPLFRRPVLIVRKLSGYHCIVIPFSSKKKVGSWFTSLRIHGRTQVALLYQMKAMSTHRLESRMAQLSDDDLVRIKHQLRMLLML